jgi:His-Xaa-Ser system protein HxsD
MKIDRRIYSDGVISKVVYWLSKDYLVTRSLVGDEAEELNLTYLVSGVSLSEKDCAKVVCPMLNDFKLREIISAEAKDIKTILYAKAFADDECFSEEDITD